MRRALDRLTLIIIAFASPASASEVPFDVPGGIVLDVPAGHMYWTDTGLFTEASYIARGKLDGSNVQILINGGMFGPEGIAIAPTLQKMYWAESGLNANPARIRRANLNGSNVETVNSAVTQPFGIAIDSTGGKLYWIDSGADKIQRANLDGSNVEDLVVSGLGITIGIALDTVAGKMYWTDRGFGKVKRANFDGTEVEDLVSITVADLWGIAVDTVAGKIYWTQILSGRIRRTNLDGSLVEDIVTSGLDLPRYITVDTTLGKLYWTGGNGCTSTIHRANLDGSEVELLVRAACNRLHVDCVPVGGTQVARGQTVDVECFVSTDVTQVFVYSALDVACSLPAGPGAQGSIDALQIITDPDGDALKGPSSGGVPYLFGPSGCCTWPSMPAGCAFFGRRGTGFPVTVPAHQTRYLGTIRYQVSQCAAGDFTMVLENFNDPPHHDDTTTFWDEVSPLPFEYSPVTLTVAGCDDELFCNGLETCDLQGGCAAGDDPCAFGMDCDEATDTCFVPPIPTISEWGLVILALLLVTGAKANRS